jgi:uncharacterized protein
VENDTFIYVKDYILTFTSILYEALPFIVLGALLAGVLEEFLPQRLITRILPRSRTLAVALGGLLGLAFPMCECGIIPVMRRLLRKGLPLSCCIAYLLAGPIINVVVMLSTYVAFSTGTNFQPTGKPNFQLAAGWMVAFRVGIAYVIAVTTALIVDRLYQKHGNALLTPLATPPPLEETPDERPLTRGELLLAVVQFVIFLKPLRLLWEALRALVMDTRNSFKRLARIAETALHDFVDITVFLCLGALLAATVRLWLTHDRIEDLSRNYSVLAVVMMMGIAVLLCLCSEADAFVAASFTKLVPAAKLSFLVLGPMLDIKLYFMYTRVFKPRLIWTIILCVVVQVFLYCMLLHWWWSNYPPRFMAVPGTMP